MSSRATTVVAIAYALALTAASATDAAGADNTGFQAKLHGAWFNPDPYVTVTTDSGDDLKVDSADAFGYGLGFEYRSSERWSWSFDLLTAEPKLSLAAEIEPGLSIRTEEAIRATPYLLGLEYHVTPGRPVDFSVALVAAWVQFGDATFNEGNGEFFQVVTDNKPGIGLRAGIESALGDGPWSFFAEATYLKVDLEARAADDPGYATKEFSYDPIIVSLGVGYRF